MENKYKTETRGGSRPGSGRKSKEKTVTTGFRVHEESLNICRAEKVPLNSEVNKLVKRLAKKISTMKKLLPALIAICSLASCATISKNIDSNYNARRERSKRTVRVYYLDTISKKPVMSVKL